MDTTVNPFIIEGYVSDEYFCDREQETDDLIRALTNGRNVTLISPRRMGKSGLIKHVFGKIRRESHDVECFYIDIMHTHSLKDFINVFAGAVFGALDNSIEKLYNNIVSVFKRCRPVLVPDAITGLISLQLNVDPSQEQHTLVQIFDYLRSKNKRIYIAFDEFQQVADYPEKGIEALLRSQIQFSPNVNFIFAGSRRHMMIEMFNLPARPFYQSTQTMSLGTIPIEAYKSFAAMHMEASGQNLKSEAFDYIYDTVFGHTWYVQYWLNKLYETNLTEIGIDEANEILAKILKENDDNFYALTRLLTTSQLAVMKGIARSRTLEMPITMDKVKELDLPAPSTVRSCIEKLVENEQLIDDRAVYSVYNRFFMIWLANLG